MKSYRIYVILSILCLSFMHESVDGQLLSSLMNFVYRGQRNAAIEDLDETKDGSRTQFDFIIVGAGISIKNSNYSYKVNLFSTSAFF